MIKSNKINRTKNHSHFYYLTLNCVQIQLMKLINCCISLWYQENKIIKIIYIQRKSNIRYKLIIQQVNTEISFYNMFCWFITDHRVVSNKNSASEKSFLFLCKYLWSEDGRHGSLLSITIHVMNYVVLIL